MQFNCCCSNFHNEHNTRFFTLAHSHRGHPLCRDTVSQSVDSLDVGWVGGRCSSGEKYVVIVQSHCGVNHLLLKFKADGVRIQKHR